MRVFHTAGQIGASVFALLFAPVRWIFCALVGGLAMLLGYVFDAQSPEDPLAEQRNFAGRVGIAIGFWFGVLMSSLFGLLIGIVSAVLVGGWLASYMRSDANTQRARV